jgi:O-antigen ligase
MGTRALSARMRPYLERATLGAVGLLVSYEAAHSIVNAPAGHVPKPLLVLLVVAGAAVLLAIATDHLVLGWLLLAPLFQESAGKSRVGHFLSLALYTAPPLAFAIKAMATRGRRPHLRGIDVAPALYALLVLGSLLITATSMVRATPVGTLRTFYATVVIGVIVYYVVAFWPGRSLQPERVCAVVLVAATLQAAMSIVEWLTGWNLWRDTGWHRGAGDNRSVATLANPGLLGAFIGVGMVVALAVLFWNGPSRLRRLSVVMVVLGPLGVFVTLTRGAILATALASAPLVLLARRSRLGGIGVLALAALMIVVFWGRIESTSLYQSRLSNGQNVDVRLALQKASLDLAAQKPILGWGYGSFDRVKANVQVTGTIGSVAASAAVRGNTSHDTFLTVLVEYGGVGLLLLVLPWLWISLNALRRIRARAPDRWIDVAGVAAVFVIVFTGATLDLRFFSFVPAVLWLFLALMRRAAADGSGTIAA